MARFPTLGAVLLAQRLHLFPWVPVFVAVGVGGYFLLYWEPSGRDFLLIGLGGLSALVLGWRLAPEVSPLFWAVGLVALGFCAAGARAHLLSGPVLEWRYYGPVQGRVVAVDRSGSDAVRLTLDQVVLARTDPARVPLRVRVSLHGDWQQPAPAPGEIVLLTGHLAPPNGPAEPGGFDFRRHAWFQQVGAVGYTRNPVVLWAEAGGAYSVAGLRAGFSARVQAGLAGEPGAFAAAVMAGDRSGMGQATLETLRASNLAHLLAISGLHMGLLAGVVFGAVRLGFAAVPFVGLRLPAKKIAALVALVAAAGYLVLSGGNVATERAFVMVAVMLLAVVFDRRALSLRAVAVAAVLVLLAQPESLLSPGFQMSFSATTALVAVFGWMRDARLRPGPRWLQPVLALVISSAVAGAATAPFGAAHFNQLSQFGLLANLLSVPLMGMLVVPAGVVAVCLMPLGLEGVALWVMGLGLRWILFVADWVAGLDGATRMIAAPGVWVLPLLTLGALWMILWQGRVRWMGMAPTAAALFLWAETERPLLLISDEGALVGVMVTDGRALSRAKGQGFVARVWLENDGAAHGQAEAAALWPEDPVADGLRLRVLRGKQADGASCTDRDWLISDRDLPDGLPCRVTDGPMLRRGGAVALMNSPDGPVQRTARDLSGCRLWSPCQ